MAYIPPLPKLLKGSRSHWSLPQVAWWSHPLHHVTPMFPCCLSQTLFPSSLEQILRQWRRSLYLVKSIAACDSAGWLIHSFGAIVGGHIYNHLYILLIQLLVFHVSALVCKASLPCVAQPQQSERFPVFSPRGRFRSNGSHAWFPEKFLQKNCDRIRFNVL